jgi:hypothetical protein
MILPVSAGFGFLKIAPPEHYFAYHIAAKSNLIRVKLPRLMRENPFQRPERKN